MTIDQILSNSNGVGDLTKNLNFKSVKLQIETLFSGIVKDFIDQTSRTVSDIISGDPGKLGYYPCPCSPSEIPNAKVLLTDETKKEVLEAYKEIVKSDIEKYKKTISFIFSGDKIEKEEPKEVEITIEKPQEVVKSLFGY